MVKKLWSLVQGKRWLTCYDENAEGRNGLPATPKQDAFMTALAYDFMFMTLSKNAEKSADE